jgi:hypothetical protein
VIDTVLPCTTREKNETRCLNDGVCVATETADHRRNASCSCAVAFSGEHCESRDSLTDTHKFQCTLNERQNVACRNNGTCFAVFISDHWTTSCFCLDGWTGKHCELKQLPDDFWLDSASLGGIVAVIFIAVAAAVILICILGWKRFHCFQSPLRSSHEAEVARLTNTQTVNCSVSKQESTA